MIIYREHTIPYNEIIIRENSLTFVASELQKISLCNVLESVGWGGVSFLVVGNTVLANFEYTIYQQYICCHTNHVALMSNDNNMNSLCSVPTRLSFE